LRQLGTKILGAKDAAFVNRMVLSYAVPVALLVGTVSVVTMGVFIALTHQVT
jgi:hypothetical protein